MKRILHIGKYYAPECGGIESVTAAHAEFAVAAGFDVSVVCFHKYGRITKEAYNGVHVKRLPGRISLASQPIGLQYLWHAILEVRRASLVHFHAPNIVAICCLMALPRTTPLLVHWHSDVVDKKVLGRLIRPLERYLLFRADIIVATSSRYARYSPSLRLAKNKVRVIPIGIPDVRRTRVSHRVEASWGSCGGEKLLLAVGRLVKYKGFNILVEACQYLRSDVKVVIVGEGPERSRLMGLAKKLKVSDRINFVGRVSERHLNWLFANAQVFCLSSVKRSEAFGVVLLEAMRSGVPIVATEILGSGVPEVNVHGETGWNVPPGDALALAEACNSILSSVALHRQFSINARHRYLSRFTDQCTCAEMLDVYEVLLNRDSK